MSRKMIVLFIIAFTSLASQGQVPCIEIDITSNAPAVIPCDSSGFTPITFNAATQLNISANETDVYTVVNTPYAPYPFTGGNTILTNQADVWSGVIPMPFSFCFFGNTYSSMLISTCGRISFDLSLAGSFDDYFLTGPPVVTAPDPVNLDMNNTIMGPFHHIHPDIAGTVSWDVYGVAPCRKMVISWNAVPLWTCNTLLNTQQIVLHETSNIIEMNIANKESCMGDLDGLAIQGIQNSTGTTAFTVPGRNSTAWTASNDSWQFKPAGNPYPFTTTYTWIDGSTNATIGTGPSLTVNVPFPQQVICEGTVTGGCTANTFIVRDTALLNIPKLNAAFTYDARLGCTSDTVDFTNTTTPATLTTYRWSFGDASLFNTQVNPSHIYGVQNAYTVVLVAKHPICINDTTNAIVDLNHPITADFTPIKDSFCVADSVQFVNLSVAAGISLSEYLLFNNFWDFGDGSTGSFNTLNVFHKYSSAGTYNIKLVITDSLGCQDSIIKTIYVDEFSSNPGLVSLEASPTEVCLGEPIFFTNFTDQGVQRTIYDFGDGNSLINRNNPIHTYNNAGTYTVSYTGFYSVCPDSTYTTVVTVNDKPLLNLGEDTSICPGKTGAIILNNVTNPSQILSWSDGSMGNSLTVSDVGYYWATAANGACETSDSIWVKRDCYLNIPNAFSPNGDGMNDYFLPRQLLSESLTSFNMQVFNRWGELIFKTNSINGRGWDGRYGGKLQPLGTYVYLIEAAWDNNYKNTFQGNFTLIR